MLKDHFFRCFDHAQWANRRILNIVDVHPRAAMLLNHILAAEQIWITRLEGGDSSALAVFPTLSSAVRVALIEENARRYRTFIDGLAETDFDRMVSYATTKGVKFETSIHDILTHVSLHGMYHRGQIAMTARDAGGEPVGTDFILFVRE